MKHFDKLFNFIRKDPILSAAWFLAIISAFVVLPDRNYADYFDFRSLGILWGLMVIISGFADNSLFEMAADTICARAKSVWQLSAMLVFLCFFSGMLITNDVALITFVPFAIMIYKSCGREDLIIPVVILQTIAANMGSMLTPIGNPQNLFIYGTSGLSLSEFIKVMLPYSSASFILLIAGIFIVPGRFDAIKHNRKIKIFIFSKKQLLIYSILFLTAIITVLRLIPWYGFVAAVFISCLVMNKKVLMKADYQLLMTFLGFFIFTGNMGRVEVFRDFLSKIVKGREFGLSIVISQFISNLPATLLLSGFSNDYSSILAGVNVGGLGTLIASMASLISYKIFANEYKDKKGRYLIFFTLISLIFLGAMILVHILSK